MFADHWLSRGAWGAKLPPTGAPAPWARKRFHAWGCPSSELHVPFPGVQPEISVWGELLYSSLVQSCRSPWSTFSCPAPAQWSLLPLRCWLLLPPSTHPDAGVTHTGSSLDWLLIWYGFVFSSYSQLGEWDFLPILWPFALKASASLPGKFQNFRCQFSFHFLWLWWKGIIYQTKYIL